MQPAVASLQLVLILFVVPVHAGVYAPSLLTDNSDDPDHEDGTIIIFNVQKPTVHGAKSTSCQDDPAWVDEDGDGCSSYASAIDSGEITQEVACGFQEPGGEEVVEGDFKGAGLHCRLTCGTCPTEPPAATAQLAPSEEDGSCVDDPNWTDEDGDGCDVYAMNIHNGSIPQAVACGFLSGEHMIESGNPEGAAQHCRATCGTCESTEEHNGEMSRVAHQAMLNVANQIVDESPPFDPAMLSAVGESGFESDSNEKPCKDDPQWVDMDGDGCAVYADVIATGQATQAAVCGRAHMDILSGNPSDAAKYCPVTCGNCHLDVFEDNDVAMKDMIRRLVEEESANILESAHLQEPAEEEHTPEVTTTTTTALKKLPDLEIPANATWAEYCAPDTAEELSNVDVLNMFAESQPQQIVKPRLPRRVQRIVKPVVASGDQQ